MSNTDPQNLNVHVENYLDYYRTLVNPQYAVLLKGGWGRGKTWFIKKLLEKYNANDENQNDAGSPQGKELKCNLYISLFGVKTIEDVETKLVSLMTSRLRKGLELAGNIAKSMIKTSLKIDIDDIFKSDNAETAGNSKIHSILDAFEKMELGAVNYSV